jgi:hypothetical protein
MKWSESVKPISYLKAHASEMLRDLHIPVKPATNSGVIRPPFGAKRRWCIIILPSGRNESRKTCFFSWILP